MVFYPYIYFMDFVLTFGFNSKVTFTLHDTVTVACDILCCIVGRGSKSAPPSTCPSHSLDSSSCMLIGLPTAWWTNPAISWAFCLALWTARRLACCLKRNTSGLQRDKTNKTCASSKDSNQPGHSQEETVIKSLATNWAHSEDSDQTGGCPGWSESLLGVQAILLVLSCYG